MLFQLLTQKVIGGLLVVFALGLTISNVSEQFGGSNGTNRDNYAQINGSGGGLGSGEEQCFDWSGAAATTSTLKSASKSKLSAQGGSDPACDALVAEVVGTIPNPGIPGVSISCKCVDSPSSNSCTGNCKRELYPTTTDYQHWVVDPIHHAPNPLPTVPCPTPSTPQSCEHSVSVAVDCCVGKILMGKCCGKKLHFGKEYCSEHALYCVPPASPSASPTPSGSGADSTGSGSGHQGSGPSGSGSGPDSTGSGHSFNHGELNNYYASLARINRFVD